MDNSKTTTQIKIDTHISEETLQIYKERYTLTLPWKYVGKMIHLIEMGDQDIGLIDISEGMYGDKSIHIDNFEVFDKSKGHGTASIQAVIEELKGNSLYLYATNTENKRFWERNGFLPMDDGTGTIIHCFTPSE
ncbi:hypothetical protein ASD24_24410 [Paenibacillus sp. Root52]|uniref:hypothetical protein n=1 Tax=Paenibacillus sp. Root52 TaxID=1736552 RepID=UPI0006FBBF9F|nr:hypothetical protein [Paenibacillus sp. Root52]KQY90943.1 hypothetical protein ASD24_24410 [Paenibacillus sp. Root52]